MSTGLPWLSVLLIVPLAAAVVLQLVPERTRVLISAVTIAATASTAVIVAGVVTHLEDGVSRGGPLTLHYEERHDWIPAIGASYHVGIDGVSGWLLALNAALFLLAAVAVSMRAARRPRFLCGLLLLTEVATTGVLVSVDLLLFYAFWEAMLIPLYLLLSSYGDSNRGPATLKFLVYTVAGSLLMLLAIIYLAVQSGRGSFDLETLLLTPGLEKQHLVVPFVAFMIAFAIKVPLVPFHTWLPDLYASAPPAVLVFFAGIVSKLGAYGMIRYGLTLFPTVVHQLQPVLVAVAVLSILYGAMLALSETDIKRVVGYASISHLGFACLGIFVLNASGLNGAVIQMVNHGVIIAGLFLIVGVIEERTGTRDRRQIAGLERRMPWLYAFFLVITLAALGLPGMSSFPGELLITLGAFQAHWTLAVLAGSGVILAAWYMLRLHQGLMQEGPAPAVAGATDVRVREGLLLAPLAGVLILLGAFPKPLGDVAGATTAQYTSIAGGALTAPSSTLSPPSSLTAPPSTLAPPPSLTGPPPTLAPPP